MTATSFTALEPSTTLMQRIMKAADKNNDGKVTLEEYQPLDVQARHHGDEHFKSADANKDSFLDFSEFTAHAEHRLAALESGRQEKKRSIK
jgi:Ca2+-binding EF-hand superfamily protein